MINSGKENHAAKTLQSQNHAPKGVREYIYPNRAMSVFFRKIPMHSGENTYDLHRSLYRHQPCLDLLRHRRVERAAVNRHVLGSSPRQGAF